MNTFPKPVLSPQLAGYTIAETIHQGSRANVYRVVETDTQRHVVIKVLAQEYPSFAELVRFRNQYTVAKNLPISGIISPLSLNAYGNGYALVMEDVGGIDLGQYARQYPLSLSEILDIAIQLANILHELHQHRVIHKDIRPANILIHPGSKRIKLSDLSIASLLPKETQALQSPQSLEGTLAYMAPEQTGRMNRAIDYRTDFYALGVTLYQLLTGQLPFNSSDPLELIHCHMAQQPIAAQQINPDVPTVVAAIAAKLMAKNAEDRYQSALGLKHDLEACLTQWQEQKKISDFVLGQQDLSDRFLIPEKLYGRETEVKTLLDAFERVSQGASELMLVAGFSGIGKTAVANEVHKPIVRQRGYFIKGKFDQFNRNIPFSAFVQAFRSLVGQLLSESDDELANWKTNILTALGKSAQVLIEVIPELEHIIGKQPTPPELSGNAAQNRFNLLFQKFIAVFTTPEHPLVIFLDDLQWADSASLNLMKVLMGDNITGYLLLLGAYRDNEVFPAHPLILTLAELEKQTAVISTITLASLSEHYINQIVAETLSCPDQHAQPLTELVYQKTKGNPFFTTQFLKGLYEDNLIVFNPNAGYWECDLVQVRDAAITDDVVEFMASRLQKLPAATQEILKLAACIGNQFDLETLAVVCETSSTEVTSNIWSALQEGLILPISEAYKFFQGEIDSVEIETIAVSYRFLHDRVQQAAYSLIPDDQKQATHYQIGHLLYTQHSETEQAIHIFEIVGQLNQGLDLVTDPEEQLAIAKLNQQASQQARLASAYQAGRVYADTALMLLGEQPWEMHYSRCLELHNLLSEFALLNGEFLVVNELFNTVRIHGQTLLDTIEIYRLQIKAYTVQNQLPKALDFIGNSTGAHASGPTFAILRN
ncbi:MAG: serine/threonine-protein kinase PknK [Cyanobacteria bacterium P01_F01_bin.86]